jgi:hypothetical protein
MRTVLLLACGLALSAVGCKSYQCTAGVCDCDPPPVHSVLRSPYAPVHAGPPPVAAVKVMPQVPPGQ